MKKKIMIAAGVALLAAAVSTSVYVNNGRNSMDDLFSANVEALAQDGSSGPHGRWRTVGCGGYRYDQWKTYCCPDQDYNDCPDSGDCDRPYNEILGCN